MSLEDAADNRHSAAGEIKLTLEKMAMIIEERFNCPHTWLPTIEAEAECVRSLCKQLLDWRFDAGIIDDQMRRILGARDRKATEQFRACLAHTAVEVAQTRFGLYYHPF